MTQIIIYPLFSNYVEVKNIIKYATHNGLTVIASQTTTNNSDSTISASITVSQILSSAQQTAIQNIFSGTAYIAFV